MEFVEFEIEALLARLNKLAENQSPNWGNMTAIGMVEHLTDMIYMSMGNSEDKLLIPEEKIESMQRFLLSDKPMAKNVEVPFAPKERNHRNDEIELAIDEFVDAYLAFQEYYSENPEQKNLHPYYGYLDKGLWERLHSKHFSHHFEQFNI